MRATLWANFIGQGVTILANVLAVPIYLSVLGIESYGLLSLFVVFVTVVALFDMGLSPVLNRMMVSFRHDRLANEEAANAIFTIGVIGLMLALAISALGVLVGPWIADVWLSHSALPRPLVQNVLILMIAGASLRLLEGLWRSALLGLDRAHVANFLVVVFVLLRTFGVLPFLLYIANDLQTFMIWQVAMFAASTLCLAVTAYRCIGSPGISLRFRLASITGFKSYARDIMFAAILSTILTQMDKVIISSSLSLQTFGIYSVAASLSGGLLQLYGPVFSSFVPRFSAAAVTDDAEALQSNFHRCAEIMVALVAPPALIMVGFAQRLLLLWTGDVEVSQGAALPLRFLALITLSSCLMHVFVAVQYGVGRVAISVRVYLIGCMVMLPAMIVSAHKLGIVGAVTTLLIGNVLLFAANAVLTLRVVLPAQARRWFIWNFLAPVGSIAFIVMSAAAVPVQEARSIGFILLLVATGIVAEAAALMSIPNVRNMIAAGMRRISKVSS